MLLINTQVLTRTPKNAASQMVSIFYRAKVPKAMPGEITT